MRDHQQVMTSSKPTHLTIVLRNSPLQQAPAECVTSEDESRQKCLTVQLNAELCGASVTGWNVGECTSEMSNRHLNYFTTSGYPDPDPMADACGTCLRMADIVASDEAVRRGQSLVLQPTDVWPPSLRGLPIAVSGTLASGTYAVKLRVVNWVDKSATSTIVFSTSELQPMVFLEGGPNRYVMSSDEVKLSAVGTSAWCFPGGTDDEQLDYQWSISCIEGPCEFSPQLSDVADSINTRFLRIGPGKLPSSCVFIFTCQTYQNSIKRAATDSVTVHVGVRPLQVRLSGVSRDGFVSSSKDTVISVGDSWDPEETTTGLRPSRGFLASWSAHEIQEQPYCPLADLPLPEVGGVWDNCPQGREEERPGLLYHIPGPVPSVGLNASLLKPGVRLQVTVSLTRDVLRLPAEILRGINSTGHRWNEADVEEKFGGSVQASIQFDVRPGSQLSVRLQPCDPVMIGQVCLSEMHSDDGQN
jgi:hypothetical protein